MKTAKQKKKTTSAVRIKSNTSAKKEAVKTGAAKKTAEKKPVSRKAAAVKKETIRVIESFPWTLEVIRHYIAEHAYFTWLDEGKPEGRSIEMWIRSEKEILNRIVKKTALADLRK